MTLGSNQSSASIFEDVEMAQDELYAGPMAESLPTSLSAFSHRRRRADSITSFAYYNEEEDEGPEELIGVDDGSVILDIGDIPFDLDEEDGFLEEEESSGPELEDGNARHDYAMRRRSSTLSRSSLHTRLLRSDSVTTDVSGHARSHGHGHGRVSQKLRMVNEDLTIVIAGFRTSTIGYIVYMFLCVATLGLAYLLLRWLPRSLVKLIGQPCPLRESDWVVLEVGGHMPDSPTLLPL
ncbi:hypothetical protein SLS62_000807 [Diatrype stigma]|uniref:Cation-transporting ATPase n=1 Tax=Diatrype stigma TaxID=117547 RepID=A0AAN9UZK0_9PEZI